MSNKRILFVEQEIAPYLPDSESSLLGKNIPQAAQGKGFEVRTFMPKFGCINERRNQLHEVIRLSGMNIIINDTDHPLIIKVASLQPSRIQVYFIDSDDFFHRLESDIDEVGSNRSDNDERAIFFTRGTMETVKKLSWEPELIHCQGWMSMLVPAYLKGMYSDYPAFRNSKVIYSIVSGGFEGTLDKSIIDKLRNDGVSEEKLKVLEAGTDMTSLHKFAIDNSDAVIFATDSVSDEIVKYVEEKGLPCLTYDKSSQGIDAYKEFYLGL